MQNNPEIEQIVENAVKLAKKLHHKYVTVEHLALSLVTFQPFNNLLKDYGADVAGLEKDLTNWVTSLVSIETKSKVTPKRTNGLERTFNRAGTQVLFSGRKTVSTIDLYLAIMSETHSHAHYFLLKYGVSKVEFVEYWGKNYKNDITPKMSEKEANELLEEHCVNLTRLAKDDKIEPVIGRTKELEDIVHYYC